MRNNYIFYSRNRLDISNNIGTQWNAQKNNSGSVFTFWNLNVENYITYKYYKVFYLNSYVSYTF